MLQCFPAFVFGCGPYFCLWHIQTVPTAGKSPKEYRQREYIWISEVPCGKHNVMVRTGLHASVPSHFQKSSGEEEQLECAACLLWSQDVRQHVRESLVLF